MRIERFRAAGFRNLAALDFSRPERICVLWGPNGQGKTNVLEAIRVASCLQSFRTHRSSDLVQFGGSGYHLRARVEADGITRDVSVSWTASGRRVEVDGARPRAVQEYLSVLPTVVFSPADTGLAHANREAGRRYVDAAAFFQNPLHAAHLQRYRRALRQRNAALRRSSREAAVWEAEIARYGALVHGERARTLGELGGMVGELYRELSRARETLSLGLSAPYLAPGPTPAYGDALAAALEKNRDEDARRGFTQAGPHRDRLEVFLDGRPVETHGSQGQRRTAALAMKLGLLRWGLRCLGAPPVLLLDDPGAELDPSRLEALGRFVTSWKGQVWVATPDPRALPLDGADDVGFYRMDLGTPCRSRP
ncbi:DNA replication/repair protein RecF [Deferrisoma palaeochoriense]